MKVVFVTQFFPSKTAINQTGGTISNRNLMRFLAKVADVTVLSFDPLFNAEEFRDEDFDVVHKPAPFWRATSLFLHWQDFVRKETRGVMLGKSAPDLLLATTSSLAAFDVVSQDTRCWAIVQAFENFGFQCRWVPSRSRLPLAKGQIIRRFQDRGLVQRADAVLTNSAFMRRAISTDLAVPVDKIHILKQRVDVLPNSRSRSGRTIGFVHRGLDKNILLVSELARRAEDLEFLVYGHAADLPDGIPPNMLLMGWSSDRNRMFSSADLWLVPSLWAEPFGRVSIEAQAADRAVLVANHGGLPETVLNPDFCLSGFDPASWLVRIRALLKMPADELQRNGAKIRELFSDEAHDRSIELALASIKSGIY